MRCSTARWTSALAAAALIALPVAASAQTPPPATPPTQQTTPQTPPAQPPADPKPAEPQAQPPQDAKVDATAAKAHLGQARDTLSKLTSLPEAAKLEGDARTQVSQLISNFNELITTQADWHAAYAKVDASLTTLLGPDQAPAPSGVSGAVGTSGAATTQVDPAIRGKLVEFRTHLKEFERAAGGAAAAMAPSAATDATANPANPTPASPANPPANPAVNPATPANPPTPMITSSPSTKMTSPDQAKATEPAADAEATKHLDAISAILDSSKTGALTKAQTTELKKHVDELRQLLQKK